jgi:glycerol dehydrogenase-like iron-containing ADH family enzyme
MENYEDLIRDFSTFKLVFDFVKSLQRSDEETWVDEYGKMVIKVGRNLVSSLFQEWDKELLSYNVILSPIIKRQIKILANHRFSTEYSKDVDIILSVGGAREHNIAREFLFKKKCDKQSQLITAPVPLTNDSFGTNRSSPYFGKVEFPSRETFYPSKIIIDLDLLEHTNMQENKNGIGEVIGFYYSLYDYYTVRRLSPPKNLIENVERNISNLITSLKEKKVTWIKLLAINLIEKCLIMRKIKDNQIGAGGDHLIAYALENYYKNDKNFNYRVPPHGKLVYLGSVIMASLFPEWKYSFFTLEKLIDIGMRVGILKFEDFNLLLNATNKNNKLIKVALQMRPSRPTSLSNLSPARIRDSYVKINEIFKEIFG